VSRVLLLGGYGGFGARIAARLADAGHEVLVAGRSGARAAAFCAGRDRMRPVAADRDGDLAAVLAAERPDALVDAAGPFQGSGYQVPRACIAAGVHYLDIADARDFVAGIAALDADARAAGVAVIAGASSVPALSGAAVRALAEGMEVVRAVEMAISASSRATAGRSVAAAILGQVGRPLLLWRGQRRTTARGWGEARRERFGPMRRWVALADVPDLALLPDRLPGRPAVAFRAGTGVALQTLALCAAGLVVRGGLARLAGLAAPVQQLMAPLGGKRSAMVVRLFGIAGGRRVERRWTLVADADDGPEVPSLAVVPLLARVLAGEVRGATDAGPLLVLAEVAPAFAGLRIATSVDEVALPPPLYARVMGADFARLPAAVRQMHDVLRDGGAHGRATVTLGTHPLARLVARAVGFPTAGEHALHVRFAEAEGVETWTRTFSGRAFSSRLRQVGPHLEERFGPLRFRFALPADDGGLTMRMVGWRLGVLPLPLALAPVSAAREWAQDGRFRFDVPIALPLVGPVVRYTGWLAPGPNVT
jgi:hypothetical protein